MDEPLTLLTDYDIYLFKQGSHFRLYEKLGAHLLHHSYGSGAFFAVWAPNAEAVSVIGDFNRWTPQTHPLQNRKDESGIWEGFIPGAQQGMCYKYHIQSRYHGYTVDKGDPYAFFWEIPPRTASVIWNLAYEWHDAEWMSQRRRRNTLSSPISIYEVHLGSWKRRVEEGRNHFLRYREISAQLPPYLREMGFTHVEFLPVMEHPFYGSWGYQTLGYFAPTSRYGTPQDFMSLVDTLHQHGIGVILDWVPSHFPADEHGLSYFDGTHLYEHADPREGFHPDWGSYIYNTGRHEVREFLMSSALFWIDKYHVDGLRLDAVASMLYRDYSRREGEWIPNNEGGRENKEAVSFLKRLNEVVYAQYPEVQTIAEESTAWPMVTRPTHVGGLGFGMKWKMGWMFDTLQYMSKDPLYRKYHQNDLTFSLWYAFYENFVLPLSHDEVVYGKKSLLEKMPGDDPQKFAHLRLLLGYMFTQPGKKLLFMGGEFAQRWEWFHEQSLDWHLLEYEPHRGIQRWVKDLNHTYTREAALHQLDFGSEGFQWIDCSDAGQSVLCYVRKARPERSRSGHLISESLLVICHFTPVPRFNYRVGVPESGTWKELLNSDAQEYGGANYGNRGRVEAENHPFHSQPFSLSLTLPPLGVLLLKKM